MTPDQPRILAFVCQHGALKSRLAAAYFNLDAPPGWHAISAGLYPQENVSVHAAPLLAGTAAASFLDSAPPRSLGPEGVAQIIGIDCHPAGASVWQLAHGDPGIAMRDELRRLVQRLVLELTTAPPEQILGRKPA